MKLAPFPYDPTDNGFDAEIQRLRKEFRLGLRVLRTAAERCDFSTVGYIGDKLDAQREALEALYTLKKQRAA